jgi:glucose-1-phosphate thymidylyltransferase
MNQAVILAAGKGSRMRRVDDSATLSADQAAVASTGVKALMPVGRPMVDYILSGLADAGYRRVCLVVGPDHQALQDHCKQFTSGRIGIDFAIQREALGTANAVSSAREFAGNADFLLLNSDNYYPVPVLQKLREVDGAAVAAFHPEGLLRGNIPRERLRSFAVLTARFDGTLDTLVEKPKDDPFADGNREVLVNMNCWRLPPEIFTACDAIPKSVRGEYELPDAVNYTIRQLNMPFRVVAVNEPVLDLSTQADVAEVTRRLASIEVRL